MSEQSWILSCPEDLNDEQQEMMRSYMEIFFEYIKGKTINEEQAQELMTLIYKSVKKDEEFIWPDTWPKQLIQ